MTNSRGRGRAAAAVAAVALMLAVWVTGCGGAHRERLEAARASQSADAYRRFIGSTNDEGLKAEAEAELALLELQELGPQPPVEAIAALLSAWGHTSAAPAIVQALAAAEYRAEVLELRDNPEAMYRALEAWMKRRRDAAPEQARQALRELNAAIFVHLERPDLNADTYLRLLRLVQSPEDRAAAIARLIAAGSRIAPAERFIAGMARFRAAWMTPELLSKWRHDVGAMLARSLANHASLALRRVYLSEFEGKAAAADWESVRAQYDLSARTRVLSAPSRAAIDGYLKDRFTRDMRAKWEMELIETNRLLADGQLAELNAYVLDHPNALLIEEVRHVLEAKTKLKELMEQKAKVLAGMGQPGPAVPVKYAPATAIPPQIYSRGVVSIETRGTAIASLTVYSSGLFLAHAPALAALPGTIEGRAHLPGLEPAPVRSVAADPARGLILFRLGTAAETATNALQPVRFRDSRVVKGDDPVTVVGFYPRTFNPVWVEGKVATKSGDLPGSSLGQTLHVVLEKPARFEGGFVFSHLGEAVGVVVAAQGGDRLMALGLADASGLIAGYYDQLAAEYTGAGPEKPTLIEP